MSGVDKIAAERATHEARGYTAEFDERWTDNQLPLSAVCYISPALSAQYDLWPWMDEAPLPVFNVERRIEQLAKAGALIAAEIDRLGRFAASQRPAVVANEPTEEEPQEYILIEPNQEPSGDETPLAMYPSSVEVHNYVLEESGDKRRWLPSQNVLDNRGIDYCSSCGAEPRLPYSSMCEACHAVFVDEANANDSALEIID